SIEVPVHLTRTDGGPATVTVTATSESDPDVTTSMEIDVYDLVMDYSSDLLDELIDEDTVTRSHAARLTAFLDTAHRMAERGNVDNAERSLDRFVDVAEQVEDDDARDALLAAAEALRQT
ncbi:MAG TPA: hypothetical protein VK053_22860, partial [Jiangellaceae bacterium]|nr:hypothetical protein [Jiangellaceae bacterium]